MCGSDLETEGGLATANLAEISRSSPFPDISPADVPLESAVNLLIETGGCRQWQTGRRLGFEIDADKLQRYRYEPGLSQPFVLEREEPLACMSDPETLADFIRWGAREYPATRYALVLWGHGGGSHTGLLPDERYDGRYMDLAELEQALAEGGLHFDTLIMDACMMANLETALAVRDHADWLVASEEIAAGSGTAYDVWLNGLYAWPECDGYRLGRNVCDSVQKKCADLGDEQAKSILTFSLVDTSKVDAVAAQFDRFWDFVSRLYEQEPRWFGFLCSVIDWISTRKTARPRIWRCWTPSMRIGRPRNGCMRARRG